MPDAAARTVTPLFVRTLMFRISILYSSLRFSSGSRATKIGPLQNPRISEALRKFGEFRTTFAPTFRLGFHYPADLSNIFSLHVTTAVLACFLRWVACCPAAEGGKLEGQDDGSVSDHDPHFAASDRRAEI
jgi:hypothetical protein